mgnify:CR=1 FL=1
MKKFFAIMFGVMIFASSTCSAAISANRFFLGGLTLEKPMSEVNKMYGTASRVEKVGQGTQYFFGDESFCIIEFGDRIVAIHSNDNNEIATPDGVTVGMAEQVISDVYGKPDRLTQQEDGLKNYIYLKSDRKYEELNFFVRENKIVGISLGYNTAK